MGALGVAAFATPAHAAPATINTVQVLATTMRVIHAPNQRGTIGIELRSGTYNVYQYGWGRLVGFGWDLRGWIWPDMSTDGGRTWSFADGTCPFGRHRLRAPVRLAHPVRSRRDRAPVCSMPDSTCATCDPAGPSAQPLCTANPDVPHASVRLGIELRSAAHELSPEGDHP
ncbi:hypothetical protein [Streptomyces sp. NPDC051001]|uniref:hypothetical protein n=1 Tax=Streptomyces sp. NPDC051001 TaxID=3155795 RepID=UPI00343F23A3